MSAVEEGIRLRGGRKKGAKRKNGFEIRKRKYIPRKGKNTDHDDDRWKKKNDYGVTRQKWVH